MLRRKGSVPVIRNTPEVTVHEYFTRGDDESINLSLVELRGTYGKNLNKICRLIYYVLRGRAFENMLITALKHSF